MPFISLRQKPVKKSIRIPSVYFLLLGLVIGFILVYILMRLVPFGGVKDNGKSKENSTANSKQVDLKDMKTLGVLVLGYGGTGHPGGFLMDAIQVVYVDFEAQKINLISVPSDLLVKFPDGSETKINESVVKLSAGAKAMKEFLGELLGLNIDYFVSVDFVGFQRAIGLHLKELEVDVAEPLDDPWYPVQGKELET